MDRSRALGAIGLVLALTLALWLRGHTFGPSLREAVGFAPYPVTGAEAEPLDCDEAVYAYMGGRIAAGAVLYRDLTEYKPPLGYWVFAAAVAAGGMTEWTVRMLPLPFVLATVAMVWWLGLRLGGPAAACLAATAYAVLSTDPYVYGNSSNMEFLINAFATASLALVVSSWERPGRRGLVAAGACLGLAALVKQVAALHLPAYGMVLLFRRATAAGPRPLPARAADVAALGLGALAPWFAAAAVLGAQGALPSARVDVLTYGRALATDTPAPPNAPPVWARWVTGNSAPDGRLPWPFGATTYLVWWGRGAWPTWAAAPVALAWLARRRGGPGRLVALWAVSAWVQVALPGLFWAHYYLLPVPAVAVSLAVAFSGSIRASCLGGKFRPANALAAALLAACLLGTAAIQARDYLGQAPANLTRYNGGPQWLADRRIGRALGRSASLWEHPSLFVWGWQSPLYFYSGLPNASRQVFVDDLLRATGGEGQPLIGPRLERIVGELRANRPPLIFAGYPPFPALAQLLAERYLPSRKVQGLWVERSSYGRFEASIGG